MKRKIKLFDLLQSTLASAFGVQSARNKARDFQEGKPTHFIIAGIIATLLFIGGLILVVRWVAGSTG